MAKVTNTFIKNKLNQDLDARLLPNGEYRNALNIQVSKSEGANVGSLENVLGNVIVKDFEALTGVDDLICIGFLTDEFNSTVYLFLTDNPKSTDLNPNAYKPTANNFIFSYNTLLDDTSNTTLLVEGAWLNFSKNFPITGINILEGLLFWTDNRNQPRKINIGRSLGYYTSEDTISVAKPAPYEAIRLLNVLESNELLFESTMQNPSQQFLPNGSENYYWNEDWQGDPNFLKDKFVRFSYRYKFDDGEYSIMAPFTQPCFIPKQNGYFLDGDQEEAYRSTVVQFLENNVTQIGLNIPFQTENPENDLHISELEIIYRESDTTNIKVVESVPVNSVVNKMKSNSTSSIPNVAALAEAALALSYNFACL